MTKKNKKLFNIKLNWPKLKLNRVDSSTININGILITCILLSIVSGFIDLVFFSNLSKSLYELFGLVSVPAGVLMSLMSIGFTLGKFWCAMRIGMLKELKSRLVAQGKSWAKNINKAIIPWHIIHKFLIGVSIITSISLSVVSIGSGITRNANTLKQIDEFIEEGTRYSEIVNTANSTQLSTIVKKASDTSEEEAIKFTSQQMNIIRPLVEDYKVERREFESQFPNANNIDWDSEWKGENANNYWTRKNEEVNAALQNAGYGRVNGPQIKALNLSIVERTIKSNYESTHTSKNNEEVNQQMGELKDSTLEEARAWITTLNTIGFVKNIKVDGKWTTVPVVFDDDESKSTKVLVDTALTQLKAFRTDVENDSGDIGSSSKIFMMIGSWIDGKNSKSASNLEEALNIKVSTGMGTTELMMMILIMIFGIVQEFLIALFTPKATIDRKILSQCSSYLEWKDEEEKERFLISVYRDYVGDGIINQQDFEAKCKKCVELMEDTEEDIIARYSKYNKSLELTNPKKTNLTSKSVTSDINPVTENTIKNTIKSVSGSTSKSEIFNTKPVVDSKAEAENRSSEEFSSKVDDLVNEISSIVASL